MLGFALRTMTIVLQSRDFIVRFPGPHGVCTTQAQAGETIVAAASAAVAGTCSLNMQSFA